MLQNALLKIFDEYPLAKQQHFKEHYLAEFIRKDIPETLDSLLDIEDLIFNASPGKGQWALAPWIAIFDPLITESAQSGFYPVYLFDRNIKKVSLSMNQGMTSIMNEFGSSKAREILIDRAKLIRYRLSNQYKIIFPEEKIDLSPPKKLSNLSMYEAGHAFGITYSENNLPDNATLLKDLLEMLRLYQLLIYKGGLENFDIDSQIKEEGEQYYSDITLEEKRKIRYHRIIERNPQLAKMAKHIHGYKCQVCEFDFGIVYGELGKEYIEAHHRIPLSQLPKDQKINLSPKNDFAVVCANCHKMIHRAGAPKTFEEFIDWFQKQNNN